MIWWQMLLVTIAGGGLVFGGVWVGYRLRGGESIIPKKQNLPVPIYNTPKDNDRIRKEARAEAQGIKFQEVA